jgi:hypothetical protein
MFVRDHEGDFQTSDFGLKPGFGSCDVVRNQRRGESGSALIELSVALFLIMTISTMTIQTMTSSWLMQNWTLAQSMTDAYAAIETANAQRWVFSEIQSSGRWLQYPATATVPVTIGSTPHGAVNGTVYRTYALSQDPTTLMQTYILESYVVYQDGQRKYCKLSKVIRTE